MSQTTLNFADIKAKTPTIEEVTAEYVEINAALDQAQDKEAKKVALQKWEDLRLRLGNWSSLTSLNFSQDTTNEDYKKAQEYSDEIQPKLTALEIAMKQRLLDSSERSQFESILGIQAFSLWSADVTTFEPVIEADLVQESKLVNQYVQLLASAEIDFQGKKVNLSGIRKYTQDSDRNIRYQAEKARWSFFEQNQPQLDSIYDHLVKLRHSMAQKLGYENYIGLGYKRMQRVDYNQNDVANYRQEVVDNVVPLAAKIIAQKAQKLNLDSVNFWDESVFDLEGNPKPQGDHDWMLKQAQSMFDAMHPELGNFFAMMTKGNFIDLKTRSGKAGGGFCTSFPEEGIPYIFANFNGTKGDVEVFTHEMGHAFQERSLSGSSSSPIYFLFTLWLCRRPFPTPSLYYSRSYTPREKPNVAANGRTLFALATIWRFNLSCSGWFMARKATYILLSFLLHRLYSCSMLCFAVLG